MTLFLSCAQRKPRAKPSNIALSRLTQLIIDMDKFRNHYSHCGQDWTDDSESANNDKCPNCRAEVSPFQSDDLLAEQQAEFKNKLMEVIAASSGLNGEPVDKVVAAVLEFLVAEAVSAENLFDIDSDEDEQVQAVPLRWI